MFSFHSANAIGSKIVVFGGSDTKEVFSDLSVLDTGTAAVISVIVVLKLVQNVGFGRARRRSTQCTALHTARRWWATGSSSLGATTVPSMLTRCMCSISVRVRLFFLNFITTGFVLVLLPTVPET